MKIKKIFGAVLFAALVCTISAAAVYADVVFDPFKLAVYEIKQNLPIVILIAAVVIATVLIIRKGKKK